jgi:hypothetical protein
MTNKKFVVKLSGEERKRLNTLISKGKATAKTILKARILLKADQSEAGEGWSDEEICHALDTNVGMVARVRDAGDGGARRGVCAQEARDAAD